MCKGHSHSHNHDDHSHDHEHNVAMEENFMQANDDLATQNKSMLENHGVTAFDFMGAIGSGKTTLIGKITSKLKNQYGIAVLNGDATTVDDFDEVALEGAQMVQISTHGACHLDADMVSRALRRDIDLHQTDLMFIENVGNLVCPADFPLGSSKRVVVVSVSEGPYTVRKHTHMFMGAEIAVINKIELAEVMGIDVDALINDIRTLNPNTKVVTTSCRTGQGINNVIELLLHRKQQAVHA